MMKKFFAALLSVVMVGSMAACSGNSASTSSAAASAAPAGSTANTAASSAAANNGSGKKVVYVVDALGDMSFNDSGNEGMKTLKTQGYNVQVVETGEDASKYDSFVDDACDGGADYIVTSSTFLDNVNKAAPTYPNVHFVVFDIDPTTKVVSNNILLITFAQNESSYLGGIVAASKSKSGVIGAVGGIENPTIEDFITGYIQGALSVNPKIKVCTSYIGNWTDSAKMLELCNTQYNTYKCDVFFPIAGGAGTGAFEAAQKANGNIWTLGVDSDQYTIFSAKKNPMANVILTSVMKRVGDSLVEVFKEDKAGSVKWGTMLKMGLSKNAVGIADDEQYQKTVPADVRQKVDDAKAKIVSGQIKVKSYFNFASASDYTAYVNAVKP